MPWKRPMPHVAGAKSGYALEKYKYEYIPIGAHGFVSAALASDAADQAEGALIISAGVKGTDGSGPASSHVEVSTTTVVGYRYMETASDVNVLWPVPFDCDVKSDVEFAVIWSSDQTTTTDTLTWAVLYKELTIDTTGIAAGSTVLDTAIAADANIGTANAIQQTSWGVINGGTLTNGTILSLQVELDAVSGATVASDILVAYYLVIRYVRRAL